MTLELLPLGVGASSTEVYYHSSFVIIADGESTLVDCPSPLRRMLYDARQQTGKQVFSEDLDNVIITHVHTDHVGGLCDHLYHLFFNKFVAPEKYVMPTIHAHEEVHKSLWKILEESMKTLKHHETLQAFDMKRENYYDAIELDEGSRSTVNNLEVEIFPTVHHIPTFALKFHHDGRTFLSYSSDTNFNPELIDWLSEADTIIHETNLGIHTPYEKLLTLPNEIKDKMYLIHYPDSFDREKSEIKCLEQGEVYKL